MPCKHDYKRARSPLMIHYVTDKRLVLFLLTLMTTTLAVGWLARIGFEAGISPVISTCDLGDGRCFLPCTFIGIGWHRESLSLYTSREILDPFRLLHHDPTR